MNPLVKGIVRLTEAVGMRFDSEFKSSFRQMLQENEYLRESMSRLMLDLENEGWQKLNAHGEWDFDRPFVERIWKRSLAMVVKNPLIKRSVNVQADYIFAQGVTVKSDDEQVNTIIQEFWEDEGNQRSLTSHPAMLTRERELQAFGNLFFAVFPANPDVEDSVPQVRLLDPIEVWDIIRNPEDYSEPWYYQRVFSDGEGKPTRTMYYPAVGLGDLSRYPLPSTAMVGEIHDTCRVFHLTTELYGKQKFALPDIYAGMDYALAYKNIVEDWATIMRSLARFAMKIVNLPGKKGAAAAKSLLQTSITTSDARERNPSTVAGGVALLGKDVDMQPVKTAGAATSLDESKPVINMVAASHGLPNTFYGDASVGNFATAKTLDRPTELKFMSRQSLWAYAFVVLLRHVCKIQGIQMKGKKIRVTFPSILERNVTDRVRAVVNAITLFGKQLSDIIPDKKMACRLILEALNVPDVEDHIKEFEKLWKSTTIEPPPLLPPGGGGAEDPSQGGDVGNNG